MDALKASATGYHRNKKMAWASVSSSAGILWSECLLSEQFLPF